MKKDYETPEFELHSLKLSDSVMNISGGEGNADDGALAGPGEE